MVPTWLQSAANQTRLRSLVLWALWVLFVYGSMEAMVTLTIHHLSHHRLPGECQADNEGQWSIGIFKGPSPLSLKPVEQWQPRANTPSSWPVANPVMTCAHVDDIPSSFVADPFLWPKDSDNWYMFYETKSLHNMQGDIGAAVSKDGGLSWKHIGIVLDEPWHLSYPFVFEHKGKMYMLPEGSNTGKLRLYSTTTFPTGWAEERVLIDQPLIDASIVPPMTGVANSDGKWYLFASNRRQPTSKNCRELEVWWADQLEGPWQPHMQNPVRAGVQGSRMAGRPVVANNRLYRFGQDCTYTYGHKVRAFEVTSLNKTHVEEREMRLDFDPASGRQGDSTWNSLRHHHMDAHQLPGGEWVALMDGDRYMSDYLTWRWVYRLPYVIASSVVVALIVGQIYLLGGCLAALSACWARASVPLAAGWQHAQSWLPVGAQQRLALHFEPGLGGAFEGESHKKGQGRGRRASSQGLSGCIQSVDGIMQRPLWLCGGLTAWQLLAVAAVLTLLAWAGMWLAWTCGRMQLLSFIMWYIRAWGGSALPIPVDNQLSKFTMVVMSFDARLITLQAFVKHYGQCASVSDIVVVWNKGRPPRLPFDLPSEVPVRVRVEKLNSMNNRFQPDPLIHSRAVLMLDDDILMPCSDVERGFARWRAHPERITGFYPRILEGDPPQYLCTQCERHTYQKGVFNVILAGASFQDQELIFPTYSAPENLKGRAYVDRVFNCDDLLLNYLMASTLKGNQYVDWVRPTKRFDVGKLTSKRLSTGNFGPVRHNCTRDFAAMFGNPLKDVAYPLDFEDMGRPMCPTGIGCMFI